ncbi:MAG: hypothetical protein HFF77_00690 [Oscillospiraceae bacterium]|nr:hypothetical protein [Oscillospiraceae bacterium]
MKLRKLHIGLRTVKTAIAIIVAMLVVELYGATSDKLIFAMLGAMSAVQPTFRESMESCFSQIIGVSMGALFSLALDALPIGPMTSIGIGVIGIIAAYNALRLKISPSLPCFILVMICLSDTMEPISYALGRIWDTAIGLGVGMLINMLILPYNNSRQIRSTIESLDKDLLRMLEDLFDGDNILPDPERMVKRVNAIEAQLDLFSNQRLLLHLRRQRQELERYRMCERKAKALVAQMEVLCGMGRPGRLNSENRRRLEANGARILDIRPLDSVMERDVVTNYHVGQVLTLRRELLEALRGGR